MNEILFLIPPAWLVTGIAFFFFCLRNQSVAIGSASSSVVGFDVVSCVATAAVFVFVADADAPASSAAFSRFSVTTSTR
jgi:uncharacterized protein (DUF486 family)